MPTRKRLDGETPPAPFEHVPEKAPPSRIARLFGASDPEGARSAIVNFLADLGPNEVTPNLIEAVLERYGVQAAKRDHVVYSIFRSTVERYLTRDVLTEEGERFIPQLAVALGIPSEEVDKVTASVVRSRKRVRGQAKQARTRAPSSSAAVRPAESAPLLCPKFHSSHVAVGKKGYGLGKAAAGFLIAGPVGLLGGLVGSKNVTITCVACGHQWLPGHK